MASPHLFYMDYKPQIVKDFSKKLKLSPEETIEYLRVLELLFSMLIRMGIKIEIQKTNGVNLFRILYDFKQENLPDGDKNLCNTIRSTRISNTNFIKKVLENTDVLYFYQDLHKRQLYKTKNKKHESSKK